MFFLKNYVKLAQTCAKTDTFLTVQKDKRRGTYSSQTAAEDFIAALAAHRATLAARDEDILFLVVVIVFKPVEVEVEVKLLLLLFVQVELGFLLGFFVFVVLVGNFLDEDFLLIAIVVGKKDDD